MLLACVFAVCVTVIAGHPENGSRARLLKASANKTLMPGHYPDPLAQMRRFYSSAIRPRRTGGGKAMDEANCSLAHLRRCTLQFLNDSYWPAHRMHDFYNYIQNSGFFMGLRWQYLKEFCGGLGKWTTCMGDELTACSTIPVLQKALDISEEEAVLTQFQLAELEYMCANVSFFVSHRSCIVKKAWSPLFWVNQLICESVFTIGDMYLPGYLCQDLQFLMDCSTRPFKTCGKEVAQEFCNISRAGLLADKTALPYCAELTCHLE